jgi:amino acid transporter
MAPESARSRTVGIPGATRVGVGAIVGGGILVLSGVAFATTGPGAILAFALNGIIAMLTALSFAAMSTAFPESGGAYAFGRQVLPVRIAFAVGWVLGFAYVVAMVMYALGFAAFAQTLGEAVLGESLPPWCTGRPIRLLLASLAIALYAVALSRRTTGGGRWSTWGKVALFVFLLLVGVVAVVRQRGAGIATGLHPFLPSGFGGLLKAMGYTFIAVQGFDLISAIAGEVRDPRRTIPASMLLSLLLALGIYLPLLFLVAVAGVPAGESVQSLAAHHQEAVIAVAARRFLGPTGYWLVVVAAILATLSALNANLLAASRVGQALARDGTLPRGLRRLHTRHLTPVVAIIAATLCGILILLLVPGLAAVAAAASLIFLISFALAHLSCILVRLRGGVTGPVFRTPLFPLVPVVGGAACLALAAFQAVVVPAAGLVAGIWLLLGLVMYFAGFARRAEALDALAEARDPQLVRLRGRSPLVLVPMANPEHARAMVEVATALRPPEVGRVTLLTIVRPDQAGTDLERATRVIDQALSESIQNRLTPEALLTLAPRPWREIVRVADAHRCESLLLGLSTVADHAGRRALEGIMSQVACDVSVLAAPVGWHLEDVSQVLVPIGGRGQQGVLRARLLGNLLRTGSRQVTFLQVLPPTASPAERTDAARYLRILCEDEALGEGIPDIVIDPDPPRVLASRAAQADLVILGVQRRSRRRKLFGSVTLQVAAAARGATIMISSRG